MGVAFLNGLNGILNLGDSDALLLGQVFTRNTGKSNGLVDTGADGLRVSNLDWDIDGGDNWDIESGFLGNLLAVLLGSTITSVTSITTISGLADSDHLDLDFLDKGDLNSLGGGVFFLLLVGKRADLVGDLLDALSADSADNIVTEFLVDDFLDGKLNWGALGLECGCADIGDFSHILDGAVVLGLFVAISWSWGVSRSWSISWGWGISVCWWGVASAGHEGKKSQESEDLK